MVKHLIFGFGLRATSTHNWPELAFTLTLFPLQRWGGREAKNLSITYSTSSVQCLTSLLPFKLFAGSSPLLPDAIFLFRRHYVLCGVLGRGIDASYASCNIALCIVKRNIYTYTETHIQQHTKHSKYMHI